MHLPLGIVLAVTLFAGIHAQNSLFEIPNVYLQFFDRSAPPPFPFRPPPAQAPFAGQGRPFGRPGPFGRGPAPFLNLSPTGEFPSPTGFGSSLPAFGQRGPFGGGRFGPARGPFGGRRPGPPGGQPGRGLFDTLSQILPAASTNEAGAGKTEETTTN